MKGIKLSKLTEKLNLEVVEKSTNYDETFITNPEINRPGLQLAGFMEEFPYQSLQIMGKAEVAYFESLDDGLRYERMRGIFSYDIPCMIFSQNAEIPQDIVDLADYYNKNLLRSDKSTTRLISKLDDQFEYVFSEETTMHACLLEIYGMGVLITGKSSVGKSETALDLVIRGHTLVADDVVDIVRLDDGLKAQCPKNIRHFLEIRGLGILDIQRLYGVGSVKTNTYIDLVIHLEKWDEGKEYDRIGLDEFTTEILGEKVTLLTIPVKPGRNIAMIVEVAVRNVRQKAYGYNAAIELNNRIFHESN
ncbi:HPr(Ser) kinase/phosphatase [Gallicola sp. Sow4_E12]|uniref:HPr(Ser) kinase/phosphatase n=1 Tax=Gallicola sp. Sow4_E12 TaxID=3438785 RepID=UPI003F90DA10